jgi:hypothetical protein
MLDLHCVDRNVIVLEGAVFAQNVCGPINAGGPGK